MERLQELKQFEGRMTSAQLREKEILETELQERSLSDWVLSALDAAQIEPLPPAPKVSTGTTLPPIGGLANANAIGAGHQGAGHHERLEWDSHVPSPSHSARASATPSPPVTIFHSGSHSAAPLKVKSSVLTMVSSGNKLPSSRSLSPDSQTVRSVRSGGDADTLISGRSTAEDDEKKTKQPRRRPDGTLPPWAAQAKEPVSSGFKIATTTTGKSEVCLVTSCVSNKSRWKEAEKAKKKEQKRLQKEMERLEKEKEERRLQNLRPWRNAESGVPAVKKPGAAAKPQVVVSEATLLATSHKNGLISKTSEGPTERDAGGEKTDVQRKSSGGGGTVARVAAKDSAKAEGPRVAGTTTSVVASRADVPMVTDRHPGEVGLGPNTGAVAGEAERHAKTTTETSRTEMREEATVDIGIGLGDGPSPRLVSEAAATVKRDVLKV